MNKSTKLLFSSTLVLSVMISISASSWLTAWMAMEINLMSFMPMMMTKNSLPSKEASLTYYVIQTMASMLLMMSIITKTVLILANLYDMMIISALMMKMGVFPFHFWLPKTMEGLSWNNCLLMMTIQKMIPMMLMSTLINNNMTTMMMLLMSVMVGSIGGMNQTSLRKMMAYSSVSNNGWMMLAMMISQTTWLLYFVLYSIMTFIITSTMKTYNNYHINQVSSMNESPGTKITLLMNMLSMSGLPPMMGFLPKLLVIQASIMKMQMTLLLMIMMMTMITIYFYLRVMFTSIMLTMNENKWSNKTKQKKNMTMMTSTMSIIGLTMMTILMGFN
uniref:NADH-ubiquinone oxidoreductase chain 2 n=1 Tax=Pulchriphyllium giganteum TaxID=591861 RepID=E2RUR8_9NEOP|nr:NADH dehydrogenase subunit 2 [Pulchriphyllium giganteum]